MWSKILDYYNQNTRLLQAQKQFLKKILNATKLCFYFYEILYRLKRNRKWYNSWSLAFFALSRRKQPFWYKMQLIFKTHFFCECKSTQKKLEKPYEKINNFSDQIPDILYLIWKNWYGFGSDHVLTKWSQI